MKKYELRQDSAGAGKFRGGLGAEKFWRAETDLSMIWIVEQSKFPAWGLFGGKSALPNLGIISPGTSKEKRVTKVAGHKLLKGEEWHVYSGGGGGWGNPYERDTKAVLQDVIGGYVSLEGATRDYGVVIKKVDDEYILDEVDTEELRKKTGT